MLFREAKQSDFEAVSKDSISRGFKEQPAVTDFVYALEHEGQVLGIGGFKLMTHTCAWVWMDLTSTAREHRIGVYRVIREWMDEFARKMGVVRLMAAVEDDFPEAIRTVEHLGFTQEGVMPKFFDKKDALLYVRFVETSNG